MPQTTDSRHDLPVAPNRLERNFTADRPDQVWLADISYIPTGEGWLYLAAIKDMATREIAGWSMADNLKARLCIDALVMGLQRCCPAQGLILRIDRGVQYASTDYRDMLERNGVVQSMMRHLERTIGLGPKSLAKFPDIQVVTEKMLDVSADIVRHLPTAVDDIETFSAYATELTWDFAHKMVKRYRGLFTNRDLCPCLSGMTVKDCIRPKSR